MISVEKIRQIESKAKEIGISEDIMMENAGANAARIVNKKVGLKNKKVLIFCGTGNNGGDGLVFARHALIYGAEVLIFFVKNPSLLRSESARKNYAILNSLKCLKKPIKFYIGKIPNISADILVDALIGTGLKNIIKEDYAEVIKKFNKMKGFKVSIDCPSGIDSDTGKVMGISVKPDLTVTFYEKKKGMNKKNSGTIAVAHIGFPKIE